MQRRALALTGSVEILRACFLLLKSFYVSPNELVFNSDHTNSMLCRVFTRKLR